MEWCELLEIPMPSREPGLKPEDSGDSPAYAHRLSQKGLTVGADSTR
uniref:Uncharacterized protein n=1 Tax=Rhizophora mucronata TaxID=61149 RepID=A0A2P2N0B6_RHIMU